MMHRTTRCYWRLVLALGAALVLAACSSLTPDFQIFHSGGEDTPGGSSGPLLSDMLRELACEQQKLTVDNRLIIPTDFLNLGSSRVPNKLEVESTASASPAALISMKQIFDNIAFVSYGTLTLDVTNIEGVNASVNAIDPLYYHPVSGSAMSVMASNSFNFTLAVSGQANGQQHRNITLNLNWDFSKMDLLRPVGADANSIVNWDPQNKFDCASKGNIMASGLAGDLALKQIVAMGLMANGEQQDVSVDPGADFLVSSGDSGPNSPLPGSGTGASGLSTSLNGVFGSQVDFTVAEGIGGGPNWSLLHFKGPSGGGSGGSSGAGGGGASNTGGSNSSSSAGSGGGSGPLSVSRSAKDTLVISFAPACIRNDEADPPTQYDRLRARLALGQLPNWALSLKCCHSYQVKKDDPGAKPLVDRFGVPYANGLIYGSSIPKRGQTFQCPAAYISEAGKADIAAKTERVLRSDQAIKELSPEKKKEAEDVIRQRETQKYLSETNPGPKLEALGAAKANNNAIILQSIVPLQ
jgi:hypothetical protein